MSKFDKENFPIIPKANWGEWSRISKWRADEAAYLFLNIDQDSFVDKDNRKVDPEYIYMINLIGNSDLCKKYSSIFKKISRKFGLEPTEQKKLLKWAKEEGIKPVWEKTYGKSIDLEARERNSLVQIVAGLLALNYGSKNILEDEVKVPEIREDLNDVGIKMDKDTIRKYLREAISILHILREKL